MYHPPNSQVELYRDTGFEVIPSNTEMRLLTEMPREDSFSYLDMLAMLGDVLISTGNKLKDLAHSGNHLPQEIS